MEERRRVPRHQVSEEFANLPANMSVRVLDISTAGVLLQSPRLLNPGSRGSLRFTLAGAPFLADIQVRRVTPDSSVRRALTWSRAADPSSSRPRSAARRSAGERRESMAWTSRGSRTFCADRRRSP